MTKAKKQRFSVSLEIEEYRALKQIAENQKPALSLQYIVSYALTEFIAVHKNRQIELDFSRRTK